MRGVVIDPSPAYIHRPLLDRFAQLPPGRREIGGWLLGYWSGGIPTITHATPPGPRGTPRGVTVAGAGHRPRFDETWAATDGHVTFVGDWHTHPGGRLRPSKQDAIALEQLARDENYGTPEPLAIIVATPRTRWSKTARQLAAFLRLQSGELTPCELIAFDEIPAAAAFEPRWEWPSEHRRRRSLRAISQRQSGRARA
jgi:integrative and conjugative element protein (TIGR02256 family)